MSRDEPPARLGEASTKFDRREDTHYHNNVRLVSSKRDDSGFTHTNLNEPSSFPLSRFDLSILRIPGWSWGRGRRSKDQQVSEVKAIPYKESLIIAHAGLAHMGVGTGHRNDDIDLRHTVIKRSKEAFPTGIVKEVAFEDSIRPTYK